MKNLLETINTIRAKGVNTPRPGTDDTTVPTVQGDMPAGKVEPNPAEKYKAVKNRMAQVKTKIIDETNGETTMPQDKVSASFLEALNQVKANAIALDEKKHKKNKHGHDAVGHEDADIDNDGDVDNSDEYLGKRRKAIAKSMKKEEVEQVDEISGKTLRTYLSKASDNMASINTQADSEKDTEKRKSLYKDLGKRRVGTNLARGKLTGEPFKKNPGVDNTLTRAKVYAEEVEQVDELSKDTLVSYRGSAKINRRQNDEIIGSQMASNSQVAKAVKDNKKRTAGIDLAAKKIAKEEVELDEAATVVLRKGGSTKRMRYNPATIERMKQEGWVVASESFVEKVRDLFNIEEDISLDDAIALVEEEQAKRGRGRPKKAVDPNAAPKKTWSPGGRGRPPKNAAERSKISTSDSKPAAASPAPKAPEKQDAGDTQHILVQLRKASTNEPGESGSGKNTIKYLNNTTGQVTASQARQALTKHDQIKTAGDRFKAQRRMGGSHEGLTGFLSGKEEKTTSKPKVSLAQPGWNKK